MTELSLERGLEALAHRTRIVNALLLASIVTSIATLPASAAESYGAVDVEGSGPDALVLLVALSYLAYVVILIASIVFVALWIYRAHANLRAAGEDGLQFTPGWAVGWYFIPIANLFKPFQAMRELWLASHRQAGGYTTEANPKLTIWWGCWVAGNIATNMGLRFSASDAGEAAATTGLLLDAVGTGLLAVAAWFLLQIVTAVTSAQREMVGPAATFA